MSVELSPRVRRRLRRAGLAVLVLAAGLALAWLAVGLLFQTLVDSGRLARWSEARLEAALNRDVELREVSLSAFPRPTAVLSDLRIGNPPGFDAPPLARIGRVRLRAALWPLLRRRVVVEEVQLSDAALRLAVRPDGRTNFGDFSPAGESAPPSGPPPFRLRVEEVELEGGSVSYRGAATGTELEARDLSSRARLRDGRVAEGDATLARDLAGEARVDGDSVIVERLRGRVLDGDLDADGVLRLDSARSWRLRVRALPHVRSLAARADADTALLDGAVAADLTLRGRGAGSASVRAVGTLRADGVALARPGWAAPLRVPSGTVRLSGDSAAGSGLPVVADGDTLRLDLAVAGVPSRLLEAGAVPTFEATLRGARLDLDALLGASPGDEVTRTRLALARLGGRPVEGRSAERLAAARAGLPDSAPASGTLGVELDELVRRPRRLTDVSARLELAPGRLGVSEADFGVLGGRVRLSGEAALGAAPAPFRLRVGAEGVEAADLLATSTPVGRLVTGRAGLSLEVSGRLDSLLLPLPEGLAGEGRLVVTEGRMRPNPVTSALASALRAPGLESPGFGRWEQPFTLRGDTLFLAPSAPEGTALPLRLGGTIGLGGGLGLAVASEVPAATARALAGRVGGLPGSLLDRAAGGGPLPVALRLVGTVEDPRVELDASALRDALEAAARQEVGSLLKRLLGRPGAPADTAEAAPDTTGASRDSAGSSAGAGGG